MSTNLRQRPQFCCVCLQTTTDYFTRREAPDLDPNRLYANAAAMESARRAWHTCMKHGQVASGNEWLAIQDAGKTTFTVHTHDHETGESAIDSTWLSLWLAIRRLESLRRPGVQVDICVDHALVGTWLYDDAPEPVSA